MAARARPSVIRFSSRRRPHWQTQFEDRSTSGEDRSTPDNELGGRRWVSNLGFEGIELMLEVRERFFQISQFIRAGISIHRMLPIQCSRRRTKANQQPKLRKMRFPISRRDGRVDPQAVHCPAVVKHVPDP
jgi:hypothetical protein